MKMDGEIFMLWLVLADRPKHSTMPLSSDSEQRICIITREVRHGKYERQQRETPLGASNSIEEGMV
ncbi:hypothetical protein [Pistricoccus aurantiacus]|uniref:Uncharacterized protein n=1 Tax=Pistricoccus aurantiacus TaxID=1883414 RepID=A0A5B8SN86_9GAMM|nr:hypothetical protein [Pistricoccus aurantiacus]QEA38529.1 hypothetical protein FGL86_05140 [Pistricoccus aurantiacus]